MKRFAELTDAEVIEITNNQERVEQLIDLECAWQGIPLLPPHPGKEPELEELANDFPYYKVGNLCFADRKEAEEIFAAVQNMRLVDSDYSTHVVTDLKPDDYNYPELEARAGVSKENYNAYHERTQLDRERKTAWQEQMNTYNKIDKQRSAIVQTFWDRFHAIQSVREQITNINADLERYLTLAEGNQNVAINFMLNARKDGSLQERDGALQYIDEKGVSHETGIARPDDVVDKF